MPANPILWGVWREDQSVNGDTTATGGSDGIGETYTNSIDTEWGKRPSIAMLNKPWVSSGAYLSFASLASYVGNIHTRHQIPMLAWRTEAWGTGLGSLPSLSLASIASGAHDAAFLTPFATAVAALNYPLIILLDEEMNGSWNGGWYDASGTTFVAMWQHVVTTFRNAGATNATWLWCANGVSPGGTLAPWWPTAAFVDLAAVDVFNTAYTKNSTWITFDQVLHGDGSQWGDSWTALTGLDTTGKVRYGLGSIGSDDRAKDGTSYLAQSATWVEDGYGIQIPHAAGAARDYSGLEFVFWFDQNVRNDGLADVREHWNISGYPLGTNTQRLASARGPNGIGSAYYLAGGAFTLQSGMGPLRPYGQTVPSDPLSDAILSTSGLQGFWWCNDSAGPLADQSGNGRTLTVNGAVALNQAGAVPSTPHTAASLPGATTAYLDGGNLPAWSIPTTNRLSSGIAFTLPVGWTPGTPATLLGVNGADGAHYEHALRINGSGICEFDAYGLLGGTHSSVTAGGVLAAGVPYMAVFAIDDTRAGRISGVGASKANLYVFSVGSSTPLTNASDDTTASSYPLSDPVSGGGSLQIGRRGDASQALPNGTKVQYAFVTNTELSAVTIGTYLRAFQTVACTNVVVTPLTSTSATITWTTSPAADSLVKYGTTTAYDQQSLPIATLVTSHSVTLTGLQANTTYHYQVVSRNAVGAVGAAVGAFTQRQLSSTQPPATGALSHTRTARVAPASTQPPSSGTLVRSVLRIREAAGAQPNTTGLGGSQPPLLGAQPRPSGALTRTLVRARTLAGAQPSGGGLGQTIGRHVFGGTQPAARGELVDVTLARGLTRADRMYSWLPELWYARASSVHALLQAEGQALDQAADDIDLVRAARLPLAADAFGLLRFETEANLTPQPEMPLEDRRERVLAHFRGIGSTIARLKTIARSWNYGEVEIVADPEGATLYITFIDTSGVPAGIEDHKAELRANVQAHIAIVWQYRFLLWGDLKRLGTTWADLKASGWTWEQLKVKKPEDL